MPPPTVLEQVRQLDPVADHQRIVLLSTRCDFPFDTTRALEFALYRTFCVPAIASLLDRTGEFTRRPQRRYDDTDLLVSEVLEWGYDSDRGRAALERINRLHAPYPIRNDLYLYVLSTFIFEPIRWNARFGWRPLCREERLALFHFWRAVGARMHIRDIPDDYDAFERFNVAYERDHFRPTPAATRVGSATRDMMLGWFPRWLRPVARTALYALMDEPMRQAFGFPRPNALARGLVLLALRLRAKVLQYLPARRGPHLRTADVHVSYPAGYRIEELGPPAPEDAGLSRPAPGLLE
jgi:hypothetical protein